MELFRRKKKEKHIMLYPGLKLEGDVQLETSSWFYNCLVKSLYIFMITYGAIGGLLSSLQMEYNGLLCGVVILIMSLFFSLIYYRRYIMDIAYIVFFIFFVWMVYRFRIYINSGYYALINEVYRVAEDYFQLPGMQYYTIQAADEVMAVTVMGCFVGTVCVILVNVILSRTMNPILMVLLTGWTFVVPIYFQLEPDGLYALLLMCGYCLIWITHGSGVYSIHKKYKAYKYKLSKGQLKSLWYLQDAHTLLQIGVGCFLLLFLLYGMISLIGKPQEFNQGMIENTYKEQTKKSVQRMITSGFPSNNRYEAKGGIAYGQVGGVSGVRPDYETDLKVTLAPYSMEPFYLRGYTGVRYNSQESCWETGRQVFEEEDELPREAYYEANRLKRVYENKASGGVGRVSVEFIDTNGGMLVPYYVAEEAQHFQDLKKATGVIEPYIEEKGVGYGSILTGNVDFEYYPLIADTLPREAGGREELGDMLDDYLEVPQQCIEAVEQASQAAGITKEDNLEEINEKILDYYSREFLYNTRPGLTPRNRDFIEHFLQRKKGYCVHFASAAVMLYRHNGIPARYVEGYVITYEDILVTGELAEEYEYQDFYQGSSILGETGVVTVEVSDARAHAWVEIYDKELGWVVEEVTVAALDPEEEQENFWDVFSRSGADEDGVAGLPDTMQLMDFRIADLGPLWFILIGLFLVIATAKGIRYGIKRYRLYQSWHTEDPVENLLAYYEMMSQEMRKRDAGYGRCPTYARQLEYLSKHLPEVHWDVEQMAQLLDEAAYSKEGISPVECRRLMIQLSMLYQEIKKNWKVWKKDE